MSKPRFVTVEVMEGAEGLVLSIGGRRVCGLKSWRGYRVLGTWSVSASSLREAISEATRKADDK